MRAVSPVSVVPAVFPPESSTVCAAARSRIKRSTKKSMKIKMSNSRRMRMNRKNRWTNWKKGKKTE